MYCLHLSPELGPSFSNYSTSDLPRMSSVAIPAAGATGAVAAAGGRRSRRSSSSSSSEGGEAAAGGAAKQAAATTGMRCRAAH